jgi:hypothetical protein
MTEAENPPLLSLNTISIITVGIMNNTKVRCILHSGADFVGVPKGYNIDKGVVYIGAHAHHFDHIKLIEIA